MVEAPLMGVLTGFVGAVGADSVGVASGPDGRAVVPDGTTEEGGSTPLGTPEEDASPVVVGTGIGPEALGALVEGRFVSTGVGAVPVEGPETPGIGGVCTGALVGKTLDTGGTASVKVGSVVVPVPAPKMPGLAGAGVVAAELVEVGRIDNGSEFERTVDNPTNRPV